MTVGMRHAVELVAMSREMVAHRLSKPKRVTGTAGSRVASQASGVEMRSWCSGTATGEEIMAGVTKRPQLCCVLPSVTSRSMPVPSDGGWASWYPARGGGCNDAGPAQIEQVQDSMARGRGAGGGLTVPLTAARPAADLATLGLRRGQRDQELGEEGFQGLLQVDRHKGGTKEAAGEADAGSVSGK